MAETIAVLSLKGGTGKTTTVRTLTDVLRRIGLDVLAVDLDPQGNLSDYFDVPPDATPTVADVLAGDAKVAAAAHDGIVPASPILAEVERSLSGKMGRELVEGALEVIEQAKEFYNPDLEWLGVVLNIADMRTTHSRDAYEKLREAFGEKVFETVIRASIAYAESAERGRSILDHRPDLGEDYLALADEILGRIGLADARRKLAPLRAAAS
jgi:chromosome partitioning protein